MANTRQGIAALNVAVAGITTSYAAASVITLDGGVAIDTNAQSLPSSGHLSHLEIRFSAVSAGAGTTVTAKLTWDAAGDFLAYGPTAATTVNVGVTTATVYGVSIAIDAEYQQPAANSVAGRLHLFLLTSAGTADVSHARLHWTA